VQRVDYDRIAHLYDEPLRDHPADAQLVAFLQGRPEGRSERARILDLGCGTGKQLLANHAAFPHVSAVGLDLFRGMLRIARARCPSARWIHGDASRIPFRSNTFDYVTNQFSYHHIQDQVGFVHEVFRVLKPGGRFVMVNIDPWSMPGWIIYRYFPRARDLDHQDFLPARAFADLMRAAGFANVQVARQGQRVSESLVSFLAYARQRHRISQLLAVSDEDYHAGIYRLEREIERDGEAATVASESCLVTIRGGRASSERPVSAQGDGASGVVAGRHGG
jgi:SAM-dependent methyltransferase